MTPDDAARIVERRDETAFVDLLRKVDVESRTLPSGPRLPMPCGPILR